MIHLVQSNNAVHMYCILSNKKGLVLCLHYVCVYVCVCVKCTKLCSSPHLCFVDKHSQAANRYYWVRLLYNRNIYNQTHISKGCPNYRCTSGTLCLFKSNTWQFLQKPSTVLAKVKLPDSCPTFIAVSNEMILRNYDNLKFDYACQILLTYQLRWSRKQIAIT
jgi:hypothetical protein